jgi:hypothetical protein
MAKMNSNEPTLDQVNNSLREQILRDRILAEARKYGSEGIMRRAVAAGVICDASGSVHIMGMKDASFNTLESVVADIYRDAPFLFVPDVSDIPDAKLLGHTPKEWSKLSPLERIKLANAVLMKK